MAGVNRTTGKATDLITFSRASGGTALRKISYGSELVTNGTFDTDTSGWTALTWLAGGTAEGILGSQTLVTTVGGIYKVTFDYLSNTGPSNALVRITNGTTNAILKDLIIPIAGPYTTYEMFFVATSTDTVITLRSLGSSTVEWDNISVKEVLFDQPDGTLTLFNHPDNIPRIDYAADGTVKGLLIEEQRTNLLTYSEDFTNPFWSQTRTTVSSDATDSPHSGILSDKVVRIAATNNFGVRFGLPSITPGVQTISLYVKRTADVDASKRCGLHLFDGAAYILNVVFDLSDGVVVSENVGSGQITDVGNGWYRIVGVSITTAQTSIPSGISGFSLVDSTGTSSIAAYTNTDTTDGFYIWGAQLEEGSFPTSYISTSGATATRAADIASISVDNFGYRQDAGAVVVDVDPISATYTQYWVNINSGSVAEEITLLSTASDRLRFALDPVGATNDADITISGAEGATLGAAAWKANSANACHGGVLGVEDTSNSPISNATTLDIGTDANGQTPLSGHIKSIKYYPRRLSNAQLQELTA